MSKHKFINNVFTVAVGMIIAQGISVISSPILTRLYSAEAIGLLGVFTSLVSLLSQEVALTFPQAIVLGEDELETKRLINISFIITTFFSILTFFILVLFKQLIIDTFDLTEISNYLIFIPLSMFFLGNIQIGQQWLIKRKLFKEKSLIAICETSFINISKIGFGFISPIGAILIIIQSVGYMIYMIMLFSIGKLWKTIVAVFSEFETSEYLATWKKYADFPKYRAPESFVNALSENLPVILLSFFFGPASAGYFTMSKKILNLPTKIIGNAIGDVFYPRISESRQKKENFSNIFLKATLILAGVGILPLGLLFLFSPRVFPIILGTEWVIAGEYSRWMSLWVFCILISRPTIKILPVLNAQKFQLCFTVIKTSLSIFTFIIGSYVFNSALIAIKLYSVTLSMMFFVLIIITYNLSVKTQNGDRITNIKE